ncbi:MAG: SRPBCC family protein, partial [Streptosporangiaceae bacterium]
MSDLKVPALTWYPHCHAAAQRLTQEEWLAKKSVTVTVNAAPAEVWAVLSDLGHYSDWHPYIHKATGELQAGSEVAFTEALQRGRTSTYPLRVEVAQPEA